jgi:hypothetical protein
MSPPVVKIHSAGRKIPTSDRVTGERRRDRRAEATGMSIGAINRLTGYDRKTSTEPHLGLTGFSAKEIRYNRIGRVLH